MFNHIATTYDQLNHTLSIGIDQSWRKKAIRMLRPYSPKQMLDIATGTGDFAILACRELQPQSLVGADISEGMMEVGREKVRQAGLTDKISFTREDCTALSFADATFDAVTVAFGVRNFEHLERGLAEMCRVLRPGGKVVVLEFSTPERFPMKQLYRFYFKQILPRVGGLVSGDRKAYEYLPASVFAFPQGDRFLQIMRSCGYRNVAQRRLTFGIASLYTGEK